MPDSKSRRMYFLADELGTLNRLMSVLELITLGRSKGVSFWGGCQDWAQVDAKYGELRTTILNSCSTPMVLNCPDATTAEQCSKLIGDQEVEETNTTITGSPTVFGDRTGQSKRMVTKRLVMAGEIQKLPPLTFFVKFPGYDWVKAEVPYIQYPNIAEPWVPNPDIKL